MPVPTNLRSAVADIVDDAIALVSISPLAKGVRLTTRLADDATCVSVDRIQIQQVLFNLMRNAIEAMEGCPQRALTLASQRAAVDMVEVSVADTGPGMLDDVLQNLFQPFVTTKPSGMGMGLSICRSIVEGHGGRLTVESHAGRGTVFRLTLPKETCARTTAPGIPRREPGLDI
jgi:two-component system, LuxR family, sensor kinase FixL